MHPCLMLMRAHLHLHRNSWHPVPGSRGTRDRGAPSAEQAAATAQRRQQAGFTIRPLAPGCRMSLCSKLAARCDGTMDTKRRRS